MDKNTLKQLKFGQKLWSFPWFKFLCAAEYTVWQEAYTVFASMVTMIQLLPVEMKTWWRWMAAQKVPSVLSDQTAEIWLNLTVFVLSM